jgi:hypothetical protein
MPPSREIRRLVVDEESNVWTLAGDADVKDPSVTPMLVEYGTDGTVKKELLSRSQFPLHADHIVENPAIGSAEMGYSEGVLWFWLPGSTELVTVSEPTGGIDMVKTGLPKKNVQLTPLMLRRESSGTVVAQVRETESNGGTRLSYHEWSPSTGTWVEFTPGACKGAWLIGVSDDNQIYSSLEGGSSRLCAFAR